MKKILLENLSAKDLHGCAAVFIELGSEKYLVSTQHRPSQRITPSDHLLIVMPPGLTNPLSKAQAALAYLGAEPKIRH